MALLCAPAIDWPAEIHTLGPLKIQSNGRGVRLEHRASTLVAWLCVHRVDGVTVASTLSELWPSLDRSAAEARLRTYTSRARRSLRPCGVDIVRRNGRLRLDDQHDRGEHGDDQFDRHPAVWFDADHFEISVHRAGAAAAHGEHSAALEWLDQALALWHADTPYPEVSTTAAGAAEHLRLTSLRRRAENLRAAMWLRFGAPVDAVVVLRRHVRRWHLDELAWRQLAVALARDGCTAEALRAIHECRRQCHAARQRPSPAVDELETLLLGGADDIPSHLFSPDEAISETPASRP